MIPAKLSSGSRPYPAVRLFPKNKMVFFSSFTGDVFASSTVAEVFSSVAFWPQEKNTNRDKINAKLVYCWTLISIVDHCMCYANRNKGVDCFHIVKNTYKNYYMSILSVDQVSKVYQSGSRKLTVLDQVNFQVQAGESISIVGPSGSGKTTLLGLCAGLDKASTGSISLN